MSGYRHSGLTQEQYDDREILRGAARVIRRRWPGLEGDTLIALADLAVQIEGEDDGE